MLVIEDDLLLWEQVLDHAHCRIWHMLVSEMDIMRKFKNRNQALGLRKATVPTTRAVL